MKIKLPVPAGGPVSLYELEIKNKQCERSELEKQIQEIEKNINPIIEKLKTGEISIFNYLILFTRADTGERIGDPMSGGMALCVLGGKEYALPEFQARYKKHLQEVLELTKNQTYPLNIEIILEGARDSITTEVDAFHPDEE